jgi:hypothetical protein
MNVESSELLGIARFKIHTEETRRAHTTKTWCEIDGNELSERQGRARAEKGSAKLTSF